MTKGSMFATRYTDAPAHPAARSRPRAWVLVLLLLAAGSAISCNGSGDDAVAAETQATAANETHPHKPSRGNAASTRRGQRSASPMDVSSPPRDRAPQQRAANQIATSKAPPIRGQAPVLEPAAIDLGVVGHQTKRSVTFELKNPTSKTVTVTKVWSSCGCMRVMFNKAPIAPGASRTGKIDISLGRVYGFFNKHVDLTLQSGQKLVLPVRAEFHPNIEVLKPKDQRRLHEIVVYGVAGQAHVDETGQVLVRSKNGTKLQIDKLRVTKGTTQIHPAMTAAVNVSGTQAMLQVTVNATHPPGPIQGRLQFKLQGLPVVIPIRGTVYKGIRTTPDHLNFSRIDSADAEKRVHLTAVDGKEFEVQTIDVQPRMKTAENALIVRVEPNPAGGFDLVATLRKPLPPGGSRLGGMVTIMTTHPDAAELSIQYLGFVANSKGRR
ncbi:MAG: DUF1573 domain-containing protein [Planctomycetota bacterium]